MKIIVVLATGIFLSGVALSSALAEDASHEQIIDALKQGGGSQPHQKWKESRFRHLVDDGAMR